MEFVKNGGEVEVAPESEVLLLHKKNFDQELKGNDVLVVYTASWCGFCKRLCKNFLLISVPEYEKLAKSMKGTQYKIARVECTVDSQLCLEQGIPGYPAIVYYRKDGKINNFHGERTAKSLEEFVRDVKPVVKQTGDALQLTKDTFSQVVKNDTQVLVSFVASWCAYCKALGIYILLKDRARV